MPTSEKARKAGFAELSRRKEGGSGRKLFKGMDEGELSDYLKEPLHKKKSKGKSKSTKDQAKALRTRY